MTRARQHLSATGPFRKDRDLLQLCKAKSCSVTTRKLLSNAIVWDIVRALELLTIEVKEEGCKLLLDDQPVGSKLSDYDIDAVAGFYISPLFRKAPPEHLARFG